MHNERESEEDLNKKESSSVEGQHGRSNGIESAKAAFV